MYGWPVRKRLRLSRLPPKPFVPTEPLRLGPLRPSNGPCASRHHVARTTVSASNDRRVERAPGQLNPTPTPLEL